MTTAALTAARKAAAAATAEHTRTVLGAMIRRRQPVSFTAVAAAAGVSREYLYRNPDLAQAIRAARTPKTAQPTSLPAPGSDPVLATLREHIRRLTADHQRDLATLRAENQQLRRHLETTLGELITLRAATSP